MMSILIDKILIITALFTVIYSNKHIPTQFEENCPRTEAEHICHCNKTVIECKNGHLNTTDLFLGISDKFYPDLDTLSITGNNFTTIESTNLFGEGVTHERLTLLDLSKNNIQHLNSHAFETTIRKLEILKLSSNNIKTITGDLLADLPKLQELWLDNAFDKELTHRELAGLLEHLFVTTKNGFDHLTELHLENNNMIYLPDPNFFCTMPALKKIYLQENRLVNFRAKLSCLQNVQHLDLSGNNVALFDSDTTDTFDKMERLLNLHLGYNPYQCDCYIAPFIKWFQKDIKRADTVIADGDKSACFTSDPVQFEADSLEDIEPDKLMCPESDKPYVHTVYIFIALALVGLFLTLACLVYQNKGPFMKTIQGGSTRYETVAGYSRLGREPEVTAEFV